MELDLLAKKGRESRESISQTDFLPIKGKEHYGIELKRGGKNYSLMKMKKTPTVGRSGNYL